RPDEVASFDPGGWRYPLAVSILAGDSLDVAGEYKGERVKPFSIIRMIINALVKPKQRIRIHEIPKGMVIDIGGGGEGVIAQAGGAGVVAVDRHMSEIHEARGKAPECLWVVADATELPYGNNCFDNATAFFSCMYMPDNTKESVFRETRRVLKKGGEFWIWDVPMAARSNVFAVRLLVDFHEDTMRTVYGVKAKDQSAASICSQLHQAGFETEVITNRKHWFLINAKRV
ncbi:MAG: class I SAM-dependent methyltransferase, partial [Anaerolineae bacterium]|nr:class I SAM-dependent methyltransferase [Anaerolineae bacterium]